MEDTLFAEREREREAKVVRGAAFKGGKKPFFFISGFDGSQAVFTLPFGRDICERGRNFLTRKGTRREGKKLS
jgi:hypothetical protein